MFTFDSSKNDYKAVMFMYDTYSPDRRKFVTVASLKGKKWRLHEFAYEIVSARDGITLHERLHYRVRVKHVWDGYGGHNTVIYFDPISEKFHMLPIPEHGREKNEIAGLGILNECLCMARQEHDRGFEILIMKQDGIKESWTSLFFIKNQEIPYFGFLVPFSVSENHYNALHT
ncbi:hypothetical protein BC332_19496 [Capsicum chinense]|nr:hypothetical protein BC332_19496 [Capsicum chinense]